MKKLVILGVLLLGCAGAAIEPSKPQRELGTLPPNFRESNPVQTVAEFKQVLAEIPIKIDQYSSPVEKAQFNKIAAQRFESLEPLRFVQNCYKQYDSNSQSLKFSIFTNLGSPKSQPLEMNLISEEKILGAYQASNAFGAKRTVIQKARTNIDIGYQTGRGNEPVSIKKPKSVVDGYEFRITMPSNEARENEKDIRCLILFKPTAPYLQEYFETHSPKLDSPSEIRVSGTVLIGRFLELWVLNQRNGKIYAKFD